jgi:hypothetical protein
MNGGDGWDELLARAKESSEGPVVPDCWGEVVEMEVGDHFVGRYRGTDTAEGFRSAAYLFWDSDNALRFIFACARLDKEFTRESPAIGTTVAIFRSENYESKYDRAEGREPTGLAYGVATEPSDDPLPSEEVDNPALGQPKAGDELPF